MVPRFRTKTGLVALNIPKEKESLTKIKKFIKTYSISINSRQEEVSRAAAAAEARRLEAEREERERKRHENELAAMRERHLRERVAHISQTAHGQKMLSNINEEVSS